VVHDGDVETRGGGRREEKAPENARHRHLDPPGPRLRPVDAERLHQLVGHRVHDADSLPVLNSCKP